MKPHIKQFGNVPGRLKSKQVKGVVEYPTIALSPCEFSEGVGWYCPPPLMLCLGVAYELTGGVSFAPAIIPPIEMSKFGVWIQFDAFDAEAKFIPSLLYYDQEERVHQQTVSHPVTGETDKVYFDIPLDHLSREGWFSCVLDVILATSLEGDQKRIKEEQGQENPKHPMILRGAWIEIQGK